MTKLTNTLYCNFYGATCVIKINESLIKAFLNLTQRNPVAE